VTTKAVNKQLKRLKSVKDDRDNRKVKKSLHRLREIAAQGYNIMDAVIECVTLYATLGEISDTLREVYGEHKEKNIF
jgi:methylmalonyl-CoA mutase N-terminal domain/subunit